MQFNRQYQSLAFVAEPSPNAIGGQLSESPRILPIAGVAVAVASAITTLVLATTAGIGNNSNWRQQPLYPEAFRAPFPVAAQQYAAMPWQGNLATVKTPHGWEYLEPPVRFATPFPAPAQQWSSFQPQGVIRSTFPDGWAGHQWAYQFDPNTPIQDHQWGSTHPLSFLPTAPTPQGWEGQQLEVRFATPLPASLQQYAAFQPRGIIFTVFPDGWRHPEWDYAFAKPFPASAQQFHIGRISRPPSQVDAQGFDRKWDIAFAKPFPVHRQQYESAQDLTNVHTTVNAYGWWGIEYDYAFAKPVPVSEQQFFTFDPEHVPDQVDVQGWFGQQFEFRFARPFPIALQQYQEVRRWGEIPPYLPPGAGKRRDFPSYVAQPPRKVKPAKPFQPIWDRKPTGGDIEQPQQRAFPAPLPPASIFAAAPAAPINPQALPRFDHLAPQNPLDLAQRMQEAQDLSDAIAVLKHLGLIG